MPATTPSPTVTPLPTPPAQENEKTLSLPVRAHNYVDIEATKTIEEHHYEEIEKIEKYTVEWHQFDGAECCDQGSSNSRAEGKS